MITLQKNGNAIQFVFDDNSGYLQNGTIDVPVNSLTLVMDSSDMATFKKSATNDIFVSALYSDFGMSRSELESWYKENMVGSTGGGGGVTPEEVEEMIDESISAITTALDDKVNVVDNEVPDYNVTNQITYQGGYPSQSETASTWDDASMFALRYNFLRNSDTNYTTTAAVIDPSGNITTGSVTTDEYGIGNPLPDYIDMVREDEEFSSKYYFTAKEGYRIAHFDIYYQRTWSSGYANIVEERVETVFEGGQSADVIKDIIEPTLINKQDVSGMTAYTTTATTNTLSGAVTAHTANTTVHVTANEKSTWNSKSDFSGNYDDLSNKPTIPTSASQLTNDSGYITSSALNGYATEAYVTAATNDMATKTWVGQQGYLTEHQSLSNYYTKSETSGATEISTALASKQSTLESGTNIKTINNESILGSGNIDIQGGGGGVNIVQTTGTSTTDVMSQDAVSTQLNNKANKTAAFGGYGFASSSDGDYIQYKNVNNSNIGNSIYYPKINGKGILTSNNIYARNNYNFQLVETSAITTAVTSSSTDVQVPSAKAVNDKLGGLSLVKLTQAQYDALATKDSNTLYIVTDS